MNAIPVITLFGGLTAFFTLALGLRLAVGKTQATKMMDDNQASS